jgi:hypothetical protein
MLYVHSLKNLRTEATKKQTWTYTVPLNDTVYPGRKLFAFSVKVGTCISFSSTKV